MPKPITIAGVLKEATRLIEQHGESAAVAVSRVFEPNKMRPEELHEAARVGLTNLVNHNRSSARSGTDAEGESDLQNGSRPRINAARNDPKAYLAHIEYSVATGVSKPLLDWTLADVSYLGATFAARAKSLNDRREFMDKLRAALEEYGAKSVGELPQEVLSDVAAQASKVWI